MARPSIARGTRDFSPAEMEKRNYIFDTIREVYKLHGFSQIETPAIENLSTLMGKYGDEGDQLLFKILNSGNPLSKISDEDLLKRDPFNFVSQACDRGLRYDLTVPFARYVVMNRNEITFPFKRFQIQPVWRADRPQKGRYREFYQCDADIIGSDSLMNEVELVQMADEVFHRFGIRVAIKLNNRKILSGIAEVIGEADKIVDITVAIDKLDKIGLEKVNEELAEKGIPKTAIDKLQPIIEISGTNKEQLATIKNFLKDSEIGVQGVEELESILESIDIVGMRCDLDIDLTLARGLSYYTGAIIEVKALDVEIGSITGGGRYDNLTGIFGLPDVSGVGISFGADRIYDVLNQLDLYPKATMTGTQVMFVNFGRNEELHILPLAKKMREAGIPVEIYPESGARMKRQMGYADVHEIPYVILLGEEEIKMNKLSVRNMNTGEQHHRTLEECLEFFVKFIKKTKR